MIRAPSRHARRNRSPRPRPGRGPGPALRAAASVRVRKQGLGRGRVRVLSARISRSSSRRSPGCGVQSCLVKVEKRSPSKRSKAPMLPLFEPQLDTIPTGRAASSIRLRAVAIASGSLIALAFHPSRRFGAGPLKICRQVAALVADPRAVHGGVLERKSRARCWGGCGARPGRAASIRPCGARCSRCSPGRSRDRPKASASRHHIRAVEYKAGRESKAPTGHRSMTLSE